MTAGECDVGSRPGTTPLTSLLTCAGSAVGRRHRQLVAAHGLSSTAFGVLGVLAEEGGLSHRELAGRLDLTPATLTPVVDILHDAGELHRARDGRDRRVVRLWITDAGRERLAAALAGVTAGLHDRLPHPSRAQEAAVRGYLLAVLATLTDDDADG